MDVSGNDHSPGRTDLSRPGNSELWLLKGTTIVHVLRPLPEKSRTGGMALGPLWGHFARGGMKNKSHHQAFYNACAPASKTMPMENCEWCNDSHIPLDRHMTIFDAMRLTSFSSYNN